MNYQYLQERRFNYYIVVLPIMIFVTVFLIWAYFAQIDEVVKAQGKVIPSSQTKVLQHFEGGIISQILVAEGEHVTPGQVLYRIKNQYFLSQRIENEIELLSKKAQVVRIKALLEEQNNLQFTDTMQQKIPSVLSNERAIFNEIKSKFQLQVDILQEQLNQKRSQLKELQVRLENLEMEYNLARENMEIQDNLREKGVISRERYLQHLSSKQKLFTQLEEARFAIPSLQSEIDEYTTKIQNEKTKIRTELFQELNDVEIEVQKLQQTIKAQLERELRTGIISPVNGIVNKLNYHTVGGIIKPGDIIAEISPIEDELMIEAKVRASDRAYIHPGQDVSIEVTAYNFARYGMIEGDLVGISPDSTQDEKTGENFYTVRIRANRYKFDDNSPILIGMTVRVSILTDKKTVMQYLLKPIRDIGYKAFKEY